MTFQQEVTVLHNYVVEAACSLSFIANSEHHLFCWREHDLFLESSRSSIWVSLVKQVS